MAETDRRQRLKRSLVKGLLVALLVTAVAYFGNRMRQAEVALATKRQQTEQTLARLARILDNARACNVPPPRVSPDDPACLEKLVAALGDVAPVVSGETRVSWRIGETGLCEERIARPEEIARRSFPMTDAWGRRVVYACPGPRHHRGWDLFSRGPEGKADGSLPEDLAVGEDVASIASDK